MKLSIDFILVTGLVITLLILFQIMKAGKKELHKKYLIIFFVFIFFVNLHAYANLHRIHLLYKVSFLFDFTIFWFLGPLLLGYINTIFEGGKKFDKNDLIHFLPCMLITLGIALPIVLSLFLTNFQPYYLTYLEENQFGIVIFRNLYFAYYIKLSLDLVYKYELAIRANYSNLSNKDIRWIKSLLFGCFTFIFIDLSTRIFDEFNVNLYFNTGFLTILSIILITIYLGYYGINQSKILLPDYIIHSGFAPKSKANSLSNYDDKEIENLIQKLEFELIENKLYLNENLDLSSLSAQLNVADKKLSTLLNTHINTSFHDYVNSFRVKEVQQRLVSADYDKYTLLAIAHECGFNSKASFNRVFKKMTGFSPSQFKKQATPSF